MSILYPFNGNYAISSKYGARTAPTSGASSDHKGLDFSVPYGTDIISSIAGTVTAAGYNSSRGNYAIVSNGGIDTLYQHLSSLFVKTGDTVRQGQTIAKSGNSGTSTAPHLHYELKIDGQNVDPSLYLQSYDQIHGGGAASAGSVKLPELDSVTAAVKKYWYWIAAGLLAVGLIDKFKD